MSSGHPIGTDSVCSATEMDMFRVHSSLSSRSHLIRPYVTPLGKATDSEPRQVKKKNADSAVTHISEIPIIRVGTMGRFSRASAV